MKNISPARSSRDHRLLPKRLYLLLFTTWFAATAHAAGIVADGGTATSVNTAAGGHQTVNLAPAIGGVSNNTYSSFSVSTAGADLNNAGVNARTIVNQVTSTKPNHARSRA